MGDSVWSAFAKPLARPIADPLSDSADREPARGRWLLLAGLLALCAVPRVWMALASDNLFPDSVVYLETCRALERGDAQPMLDRFGLNVYPILLMLLHRTGLAWDVAGQWWSVAMGCLAVLPLFGWIRRMFDARVATVACVLYAIHPRFIYVAPLVLRDPTFWFAFNAAIYFLWRAAVEVRPTQIALAIAALAIAAHTRVEGWLLLLPTFTWLILARRRILPQWRSALAGMLLSAFLLAACGAALLLALPHDAAAGALADWRPWHHLLHWLNMLTGHSLWPRLDPSWSYPVERSGVSLVVSLLLRCVKAHTYAYMLLALVGLGCCWRVYLRPDQRGLALFTLTILVVLGLHFRRNEIDEMRYFLSMILVGLPYMALGLLAAANGLGRLAAGHRASAWAAPALACAIAVALAAGSAVQLSEYQRPELRQIVLGKWIRENLGPHHRILGSVKHMGLTAYYADGRLIPYPGSTEYAAEPLLESIAARNPSVVILWNNFRYPGVDPYIAMLDRFLQCGYEQIDARRLPPLCRDTVVLVRSARETSRNAAMPEATATTRQ